MKSWGATPEGERGVISKLQALKGSISQGQCQGQTVDFQMDYTKIPWLRNGKQKVTLQWSTFWSKFLFKTLKPESKTLGSVFPI
jgi:hypothetical protein